MKFGSSLGLEGKQTHRVQWAVLRTKTSDGEQPLSGYQPYRHNCTWCEKEKALAPKPPLARGRGQRAIRGVCPGSLDTKAERI